MGDGNFEAFQVNPALETGGESLNHAGTEQRFRVMHQDREKKGKD
ncbi:MAG TPA: hypothetical protein VIX19_07395 [Terriglobales bacterium]